MEELRLNSQSLAFVEDLYADFLVDPDSVSPEWRECFNRLDGSENRAAPGSPMASPATGRRPEFPRASIFNPAGNGHAPAGAAEAGPSAQAQSDADDVALQHNIEKLVRSYRVRGHLIAKLDPLGRRRPKVEELDPACYGISMADLGRKVSSDTVYGPPGLTVGQVLERLHSTYCRYVAVQYMHIDDVEPKTFLMERMEMSQNRISLTDAEQIRILTKLTDAVMFEEFLQTKFVGAKSFSLEGGESLIPLVDMLIEKAGDEGVEEIVIAMAHRGRLNVLANIMDKCPSLIFREFEDADPDFQMGRGDVKYHLGYSRDWVTERGNPVHLSLCFNPSHLEFVNPVALGRVRAKQDRVGHGAYNRCMGLVIHGDAAFAGEGVVQETFNLSALDAYNTGGTVHIVVNNQIGFTTSPSQSRSNTYATAVAKMLQIPIFHVNGEDPEGVAQTLKLAMDFRSRYGRDVVIDMYCYRRRGHNESDEPAFTQPLLYEAIGKRKTVREGYLHHLLRLGGVTESQAGEIERTRREYLEGELKIARDGDLRPICELPGGVWAGYRGSDEAGVKHVETGVAADRLAHLLRVQTQMPSDFHAHRKIVRMLEGRAAMAEGERPLDWAAAEALAFASLSTEGYRLRMTGQDCERGTFSHRHAVLHDVKDGHTYMPLAHHGEDQAPITIANSPLSEIGVLGFEYGYSLDTPRGLVIWEAQFGDFANVAQVIIDQFIVSAEDKWFRFSGLVMLLPHGFEGLGPEHSSARLERYLMLAADHNIQVIQPTTPAQYFHALRRQVLSNWRKPLIVMTPKSLLRSPVCVSPLGDLASGRFQRVLQDEPVSAGRDPKTIRRILLCTGKIYFDLVAHREELKREDVAIVRIEELYPLTDDDVASVLDPYADGIPAVWVQDEPENMGAWRHLRIRFGETLLGRFALSCVSRESSASPATGSMAAHRIEREEILDKAFGELT